MTFRSAAILALLILSPTGNAMLPGPDQIKRCPGVETALRFFTLLSGNTFGATFWTDGKMDAPMLPTTPGIWKAGPDEVIFWEEDCELIEEVELGDEPSVPTVEPSPLREADFYRALDEGLGNTPTREEYLRLLTWRASNDKFRYPSDATRARRDPRAIANMQALFALLNENVDESTRLSKAEVARQLGSFEVAAALLEHPFSERYLPAVEQIRALIAARDRMVQEIRETS